MLQAVFVPQGPLRRGLHHAPVRGYVFRRCEECLSSGTIEHDEAGLHPLVQMAASSREFSWAS